MTDEKFSNFLLIFWILSSFIAKCKKKNYFIHLVTTPKCHSIINSELNAVEWIFFPYISHKNLNFHSSNIFFFTIRRNINGKWKFKWYKRRNSERNKRLFWMFLRYHRFISIWTIWRWHQQLPSQFHHSPFCFYFCFNSIAIFFLGVSQRN